MLAHAGQLLRRAVVLVPLPLHDLVVAVAAVEDLRRRPEVVGPAELLYTPLPVPLLAHELVDRVVELAYAVLVEPLVLDERHLLRDLLQDLPAVQLAVGHVVALGREVRPHAFVLAVLVALGRHELVEHGLRLLLIARHFLRAAQRATQQRTQHEA